MKFVNLTPWTYSLASDGDWFDLKPSGTVAGVEPFGFLDDEEGHTVAVEHGTYAALQDLPAPEHGVVYVCTRQVAEVARRPDVLSIGEPVFDEEGDLLGYEGLCAHVPSLPAVD